MNQAKPFTIESTIEFAFNETRLRDISYNSFIPEIKKLQTNRSQVLIEKKNQLNLIFKVESNDITAFRASVNEIISFGKVITNTMKIIENS